MKAKTKTIAAITLVALLVGIAAAAYTARQDTYAAIYRFEPGVTITGIVKAQNREAAWKKAKRRTPKHGTLINVYQWLPPWPPFPSTEPEELIDP